MTSIVRMSNSLLVVPFDRKHFLAAGMLLGISSIGYLFSTISGVQFGCNLQVSPGWKFGRALQERFVSCFFSCLFGVDRRQKLVEGDMLVLCSSFSGWKVCNLITWCVSLATFLFIWKTRRVSMVIRLCRLHCLYLFTQTGAPQVSARPGRSGSSL